MIDKDLILKDLDINMKTLVVQQNDIISKIKYFKDNVKLLSTQQIEIGTQINYTQNLIKVISEGHFDKKIDKSFEDVELIDNKKETSDDSNKG